MDHFFLILLISLIILVLFIVYIHKYFTYKIYSILLSKFSIVAKNDIVIFKKDSLLKPLFSSQD